jgi:hypothetical protein
MYVGRFPYSDRKVTQLIPDTCYICQQISYIEISKQKAMQY